MIRPQTWFFIFAAIAGLGALWFVLCAAVPRLRAPNPKEKQGSTVRDCLALAAVAFTVALVFALVGVATKP